MKSGDHYKTWNCAERQKGKNGNGCKCRIIKEGELTAEVLKVLGWEQMDEARFEAEVERALVFDDRIVIKGKTMERST